MALTICGCPKPKESLVKGVDEAGEIMIVPMTLEHVDGVYEAELECFTIPWLKSAFVREISENENAYYFAALAGGKVAGYAGLWHIVNEGHITNIAVRKAYRNRGVGDALLKRLIALAVEKEMIGLTLEVRVSNAAALRLYEKNGFTREGLRKNYYEDTKEDAIIMWRLEARA